MVIQKTGTRRNAFTQKAPHKPNELINIFKQLHKNKKPIKIPYTQAYPNINIQKSNQEPKDNNPIQRNSIPVQPDSSTNKPHSFKSKS